MPVRPKVLVIAEAANPEWTSVPLIGWSLANALREVADSHLVTQVRNTAAIERAGWRQGIEFTSIDTEPLARPLFKFSESLRLGWTGQQAIMSVIYPYFERCIWRQFGKSITERNYDIVHRVTPVSPAANSPLANWCHKVGVPFILGPINGGVPWPKGFSQELANEREFLSHVRSLFKLNPKRHTMLRTASAILVGSRSALNDIPKVYREKCRYIPENAIDPSRFNLTAKQIGTLPLRACYIGRLVPLKGIDMLLQAAGHLLSDGRMLLDIIGDGPCRGELETLTKDLGITSSVTFHGWLEHKQVQKIATQNHIMTFPSIREFGGGAILEAMALGLVPIVVDYAGPGELVEAETGFKVPLGRRPDIILGFRNCLEEIVQNPKKLASIAQAGQRKTLEKFTWSAKAQQICNIYNELLEI